MPKLETPRYFRVRRLKGGAKGYYWQPPDWARPPAVRAGHVCPVSAEALGGNLANAIAKCERLNAMFDDWRKGVEPSQPHGTVKWLFGWYRTLRKFKEKASKTRLDYSKMMSIIEQFPMRQGVMGDRTAALVDGAVADKLYDKLAETRGERTAGYAMQVCRLVWTQAVRHKSNTGVSDNPFSKMGISTKAKVGNRATSRTEYDLYRKVAHELGFHSMAAAAALCFELCQRVTDVFGYVDEEKAWRGIRWEDYVPGKSIRLTQSKSGLLIPIPLSADIGEACLESLYPQLEAELANIARGYGVIVVEERNGQRYEERRVSAVHRKICNAAGLPRNMTFTGFRHGGLTEIGDAGLVDSRAVSGHKTLNTTAIYNKANREKAIRIAQVRQHHVEVLGLRDE